MVNFFMGIKNLLKSILGKNLLSEWKGQALYYLTTTELSLEKESKFILSAPEYQLMYHLEDKDFHVFRGYYDIKYMSNDDKKILTHRLPVRSDKNTEIEIGYYNLPDKSFHKVSNSSAWCWQQGSRLRWHPTDDNYIVFNDTIDNEYCTRVFNYKNGTEEKRICRALYDVSHDFTWGLSLNYSRLQRKRPGYGYNALADNTAGINAPDNDGIFFVDIQNNTSYLKYSLKDLANRSGFDQNHEYYINHISISPDDSKYLFFLIFTIPGKKGWQTTLFVADRKTDELTILEKNNHFYYIIHIQ